MPIWCDVAQACNNLDGELPGHLSRVGHFDAFFGSFVGPFLLSLDPLRFGFILKTQILPIGLFERKKLAPQESWCGASRGDLAPRRGNFERERERERPLRAPHTIDHYAPLPALVRAFDESSPGTLDNADSRLGSLLKEF